MATAYDWIVEELEDGEIVDVHYFDSYEEAEHYAVSLDSFSIGLCKKKSNKDIDSVDSFSYAYIEDGRLSALFDDGSKVPVKYAKEVKFKL